jgi:ABC-type Fe3+-hydroxamate transport system substrate-binding protein
MNKHLFEAVVSFDLSGWKRACLLMMLICLVFSLSESTSAKRIVSLSPSLTKNIHYLGDEAELVGRTSYCKTNRSIPIVASAVKVNIEKVVSVKPDLVLATSMTTPETVAILRKMGICVEVLPMPKSFDEICSQFLRLGKLIGKESKAKEIISTTRTKVNKMKATPTHSRKVFIQLGANPLFGVITKTFMNDYMTFSGAKNIADGMTSGTITREAVLLRDPDVIFIVTMGILAQEEKKQWEKYPNLSATRLKKIYIIDSDKACNPTPVTFAETLELISRYLN